VRIELVGQTSALRDFQVAVLQLSVKARLDIDISSNLAAEKIASLGLTKSYDYFILVSRRRYTLENSAIYVLLFPVLEALVIVTRAYGADWLKWFFRNLTLVMNFLGN